MTICIPHLASWLSFCLQPFLYKVYISVRKQWICKKVRNYLSHIPTLASFIIVGVLVSSILIGCVRPLRPIRDNAGPGEVESGKCGIPLGSPLHYSGRGVGGGRSRIFLSPWVTYDLPSRFTYPQELASNTVNMCFLEGLSSEMAWAKMVSIDRFSERIKWRFSADFVSSLSCERSF